MEAVYTYRVEDADADGWTAEVAVAAASPVEAGRRVRALGLHKKQIQNDGRPVRVLGVSEVPEVLQSPIGVARRRSDDDGWTGWSPVDGGTSLNWRRTAR
jgi:hypothetical protein